MRHDCREMAVRERQRIRQANRTTRESRDRSTLEPSDHISQLLPDKRRSPNRGGISPSYALWICLALGAAIMMVFAPVRHFSFVFWDDPVYVTKNPDVTAGLSWRGVTWAFTTFHAGLWIPLVWISY